MMQAMITALGFHAENMQRQVNGESMAYHADSFFCLVREAEARKCKLEIEYGSFNSLKAYIDGNSVGAIRYDKISKSTFIYLKGDDVPITIKDSELGHESKEKLQEFIKKWMLL